MKWLASILLVLNIVLFAWGKFHGEANIAQQKIAPPVGNLKLVSELEAEARRIEESIRISEEKKTEEKRIAKAKLEAAKKEELAKLELEKQKLEQKAREQKRESQQAVISVKEPANASSLKSQDIEQKIIVKNCRTIGPFSSIEDAKAVAVQLASGGVAAKTKKQVTVDREGYWVLIPSQGSIDDGKLELKKLAAAGVEDTWLFRKGDMKGSISLGLFSQEKNAKRRANAVRVKGFSVSVQPKSSEKTTVWLEFQKPRRALPGNYIKGLQNKYKGLKYTKKACRKK